MGFTSPRSRPIFVCARIGAGRPTSWSSARLNNSLIRPLSDYNGPEMSATSAEHATGPDNARGAPGPAHRRS
ncbi:hypothetical protein QJS66_06010 [Kocuria rhizophila]|nr:hypothetical protein QJS66_06010 [Kocuria rhizophila]